MTSGQGQTAELGVHGLSGGDAFGRRQLVAQPTGVGG
jgi:hypothetical protein